MGQKLQVIGAEPLSGDCSWFQVLFVVAQLHSNIISRSVLFRFFVCTSV